MGSKKTWKRIGISAAIVIASVALTVGLNDNVGIFQTLALKAYDAHFVLRGKVPTKDIFIIAVDEKAEDKIPDPSLFWQKYYAEAITAAASAGAKDFHARRGVWDSGRQVGTRCRCRAGRSLCRCHARDANHVRICRQ